MQQKVGNMNQCESCKAEKCEPLDIAPDGRAVCHECNGTLRRRRLLLWLGFPAKTIDKIEGMKERMSEVQDEPQDQSRATD